MTLPTIKLPDYDEIMGNRPKSKRKRLSRAVEIRYFKSIKVNVVYVELKKLLIMEK
jgi:hypothetical protein